MQEVVKAAPDAGTSNTARDSGCGLWGCSFLESSYFYFITSPRAAQEGVDAAA